jgi:hypothetical protein
MAHADAGIPMLPVAYPIILWFLLPVIAIEVAYVWFRLHTNWRNTVVTTSGANLITLLLGYPLAWLIFLLLEFLFWGALSFTGILNHVGSAPHAWEEVLSVILSSAWMGPGGDERWPILLAFVVLLIPSLLLSGYVESYLLGSQGWLRCEGRRARGVAGEYAFVRFPRDCRMHSPLAGAERIGPVARPRASFDGT